MGFDLEADEDRDTALRVEAANKLRSSGRPITEEALVAEVARLLKTRSVGVVADEERDLAQNGK